MSLDKIKSLLIERQKAAQEYQAIAQQAEKIIAAKLAEANILEAVQAVHAEREGHRQRLQQVADQLTGKVQGLMEASGITDDEIKASFHADAAAAQEAQAPVEEVAAEA